MKGTNIKLEKTEKGNYMASCWIGEIMICMKGKTIKSALKKLSESIAMFYPLKENTN